MLKDIVDETSHGKYDFMYLRIGKFHSSLNSGCIHSANNCLLFLLPRFRK